MMSVVSTQSMQQAGAPESSVSITWRVRAISAARRISDWWHRALTACCRRRQAAAAQTETQAAVASDFFSPTRVAKDNAIEAAMNAAASSKKAVEAACEAVQAASNAAAEAREASDDDDFTVVELNRAKSV